ncbi:hypothetical protein BGX29_010911 [Mortierella sp. GBA35]|nr:hypothetical protein BGX29_010911 [Mortierella sp. GBA35]
MVATPPFTDLPVEVQVMVAPYLSLHDLAMCVRVCRTWKTIYSPFLWRHIKGKRKPPWWFGGEQGLSWNEIFLKCAAAGALRTNGHLIQSLSLSFDEDDTYKDDDEVNQDGDNADEDDERDQFERLLEYCPPTFPQLTSISLDGLGNRDKLIVDILRRGTAGWRELEFGLYDVDHRTSLGAKVTKIILDNASTLEVLKLDCAWWFSSKHLQQLLCTARNLREFNVLGGMRTYGPADPSIDAHDVVGSEWVCMDLEVFGCEIGKIPRPDITRRIDGRPASKLVAGTLQESIDLQRRVYAQLGRLTKMRELSLGAPYDDDECDDYRRDLGIRLFDCLAMSLESGLGLLKDLKQLRKVGVEDMEVYIGRKRERLWVKQNWQRVKDIPCS